MMYKFPALCARFFDKRFLFTAGIYVAFVAVVIAVAAALAGRGVLAFIDHPFLAYAEAIRSDALTPVMRATTMLGSGTIVVGLSIVGVMWLLYRGMAVYAVAFITSVVGASGVTVVMKWVLERPRPSGFQALMEHTFSFPSGHAALSLAFFGILVYFLIRHTSRRSLQVFAVLVGGMIIIAIGVSRVYLGVHWPSDVVGSYVLVGLWLAIVIRQMERKCVEV
ncbi:MAG: phosphatase PAP2 family protein [Candidatus Azambacteria bacterium]|nr:phosphatase PAP2 family protein [Candidatus Azambacteria bacterium]